MQAMKKRLFLIALTVVFAGRFIPAVLVDAKAAEATETEMEAEASQSAEATAAAAAVTTADQEKRAEADLTQPTGPAQGKLEQYLLEKDPGPLSITNFLQHAMRGAVAKGVPATTLVLILLFPLVGAIIAAARHLVGLRGYGLLTTAALSIAFLATGILEGILLFLVILAAATVSRVLFRRLRLQYLPRIALLLWLVSLAIFALLSLLPYLAVSTIYTISIFPILLLVLLTETFISSQIGLGMRKAVEQAYETVILAVVCSLVLSLEFLQKFAVLNPEVTVLSVAVFDLFLGKYVGLRLLEYWRFRELIS